MLAHSQKVLIVHGCFLMMLGCVVFLHALVGYQYSLGRFQFLSSNPIAAVGFLEAYGLAALIGLSLIFGSRAIPVRPWHLLGALTHLFLFGINVSFWDLYEPLGLSTVGWVATSAHVAIFLLQITIFVGLRLNER